MSKSLREYEQFIDSLVAIAPSVTASRIRKGIWHVEPPPDQKKYCELLRGLSKEQRTLVAEMVQQAANGAIHDVLVVITDGGYRLSRGGTELAWEPFGTEMYYDFVCRREGDKWPRRRDKK